ncbi:hypothetical protein K7W03_18855 [Sphingobium sp. PNB]|uniref:hypothetical protein n=1 Tax=Sphingobium sp. PNB TaxID=863934 RepID=UPI001CA3A5C3|nr:hypothetical protein [Sphingobium sp. PNB]MCB4861653.1 hypothetical protein [Sphingobium sp. PNB]
MNNADLLEALDFNAANCGDALARVYYGQAATAIRRLERASAHWQTMAAIERGSAMEARIQNKQLQVRLIALEALLPSSMDEPPLPSAPSGEGSDHG